MKNAFVKASLEHGYWIILVERSPSAQRAEWRTESTMVGQVRKEEGTFSANFKTTKPWEIGLIADQR